MLKLAWRGVRYNTGRYVATLVAIITGVAFFAATGFLGDRVVEALEGDTQRQFAGVDVAVTVESSDDDESGFGAELRLPKAVADQVVGVDGVDGFAFVLSGQVELQDGEGDLLTDGAMGRLWSTDDALNPIDVKEGRAPQASGEIAVDRGIASENGFEVGDRSTLLTISGSHAVTIVGITKFGNNDALDSNGTISVSESDAFAWLAGGNAEYEAIYLRGSDSQDDFLARVTPLVPAGFEALAGDEFLKDKIEEIGATGTILKKGLRGFALLALFVGAFVIYNTFSVLVAQRLKELAVLRAIGATPRQVRQALSFEGLVVGVLGSILGLIVGLGFVYLLVFVLGLFDVDVPGSGVVISAGTVRNSLLLGTIITVLSVMVPARRAARTEPIEALRDAAVESTPYTRSRLVATGILTAIGMLCLFVASHAAYIGIGLACVFVATIAAGPIFAVAAAKLTKPFMSRLGLEGRLASDNSARNPTRTATTANALLIGVFLVTLVSVAGVSLKDYVVEEIKSVESADFLLSSEGGSLDSSLITGIEGVDGVERVEAYRRESIVVDGSPSLVSSANVEMLLDMTDIKVATGSLEGLRPGTIAVLVGTAAVGDTVTIAPTGGEGLDLEVVALLEDSIDLFQVGSLISADDFEQLVGSTAPTVAFIDVASGATTETTQMLEEFISGRPDLFLVEGNAIGKLIGGLFDFMINAVNGLLGMSVLVAVIGIVNTLSLSVFERRRELGLLRVVGMLDKSVQRMIRLESMLIAALGTLVGVALGLFSGWIVVRSIRRLGDVEIEMGFAPGRVGLIILAGVILGVVASLLPAKRSTRLDVLDAIQAA